MEKISLLRSLQLLVMSVASLMGQAQPVSLPIAHYKYQITQQVCRQLAASFGGRRLPRLRIVSDPKSQRIAQFVPLPEPELFLDEKLYDLCRQFGTDSLSALALIVGHELTHYYEKHADWLGFGQPHRSPAAGQLQTEQMLLLEAQADMLGFYHAFLAGYTVYPVSRKLYSAIYKEYHLPDQMEGYPSRVQRIQTMEEQAIKANRLGVAFDVGVFFLLQQQYAVAERCFTFVEEEIPTKELLNNVGVSQLLMAMQAMTLREMPFRFPVEMASTNRLRLEDHRGSNVDKADLLKRAVANFQYAIDLDNSYVTAYINQATALSLLGRNGGAKEVIDELESVLNQAKKTLPPNARLIRSIALIELGNMVQGNADLEHCSGAYELVYNREVAKQYAQLQSPDSSSVSRALNELRDRYTTSTVKASLVPEHSSGLISLPIPVTITFSERLAIPEPNLVRIQAGTVQGQAIYRIQLTDSSIDVVRSQPKSPVQSAKGIKSGDSVQLLLNQYGEPDRLMLSDNGLTYYCYDSARFIVMIQDERVRNWFMYVRQ